VGVVLLIFAVVAGATVGPVAPGAAVVLLVSGAHRCHRTVRMVAFHRRRDRPGRHKAGPGARVPVPEVEVHGAFGHEIDAVSDERSMGASPPIPVVARRVLGELLPALVS